MSDIFNEVDDALKQDKVEQWWKDNGGYVIWFCACLIVFTGVTTFVRGWIESNKQAETAQVVALYETQDQSAAFDALKAYAGEAEDDLQKLSLIQAANMAFKAQENEKAFEVLKSLAESGDGLYEDYARLIYVTNKLNKEEFDFDGYKPLLVFLNPILELKSPWMSAAMEVKATIETKMGLYDNAMTSFLQITELPNVDQSRVARAYKAYHVVGVMKQQAEK